MDQLIKRVLAVGPGLAPIDRPGVVVDAHAVDRHVLAVALHGELLEIGGKALEILLVGQHGDGLGAEEVRVPHADAGPSAPADCVRTAPSGNARPSRGSRPAWRGNCPGRSPAWSRGRWPSPSNSGRRPNPRSRTCWRCRCRISRLPLRWSTRRQSAWRWRLLVLQARQQPVARRVRVGHGFQRGEGLGGDDEQRLGRIEIAHRFGEIRAVDVGDETESHGAVAVVLQRFIGHDRAEIGAADADIDDVADAFAGMAFPARRCARRLEKSAILSRTACTSGTTLRPSCMMRAPRGARSATCSTARFSETLILSPRNMASMRSRRPTRGRAAAAASAFRR